MPGLLIVKKDVLMTKLLSHMVPVLKLMARDLHDDG
jgi:hypothetical protein